MFTLNLKTDDSESSLKKTNVKLWECMRNPAFPNTSEPYPFANQVGVCDHVSYAEGSVMKVSDMRTMLKLLNQIGECSISVCFMSQTLPVDSLHWQIISSKLNFCRNSWSLFSYTDKDCQKISSITACCYELHSDMSSWLKRLDDSCILLDTVLGY